MLTEAGGMLARHLTLSPEHPRWCPGIPDSLVQEILSLSRRVPGAWGVLYRAAADTVIVLESTRGIPR